MDQQGQWQVDMRTAQIDGPFGMYMQEAHQEDTRAKGRSVCSSLAGKTG